MEKREDERRDAREALGRGTALTVRVGKEKRRLVIRRQISAGRECLVYLAESADAGGAGREIAVKEFYPADMPSVSRRGTALAVPRADRAWFQERAGRFAEGKTAYSDLYAEGKPIFACGTANGTVYAVTDPADGGVMRLQGKGETLSEVLSLVRDIARELAALHAHGLVYLDLRPEHVFVTRMGEARLMDVDSAVTAGERPDRIPVPAGCAAPELCGAEKELPSAASDLYALGALFFARLTGRFPEAEERQAILDGSFPYEDKMPLLAGRDCVGAVGVMLSSCLAEHPGDRADSAEALAEALDALIKSQPQESSVPREVRFLRTEAEPSGERAARTDSGRDRRRHPVLAALVLVLAALNAAVWLGPAEWLRPLRAPVEALQALVRGGQDGGNTTPSGGRYSGTAQWQDLTFRVDQRANGGLVMLKYEVGETTVTVGRNASVTAVTDRGSCVIPFMSAGQALLPGSVGTLPMQFSEMEGTLEYLIVYGLIPMNPDGKTAAQEATSVTVNIVYTPEGGMDG